MQINSVALRVGIECPGCERSLRCRGLNEHVTCPGCGHASSLAPALWAEVLEVALRRSLEMSLDDEDRDWTTHPENSKRSFNVDYARRAPACTGCKQAFADDDLVAASKSAQLRCRGCAVTPTVRRTPPALASLIGGFQAVLIGEDVGGAITVDDPFTFHLLRVDRDSVGVLPEEVDDFCDFTHDRAGNLIIAYRVEDPGEAGHPARLACLDPRGMLRWIQSGIEFGDRARLIDNPAAAEIALADQAAGVLHFIDPRDGSSLRTISGLDLAGYPGPDVGLAADGSVLATGDKRTTLRRLDSSGQPLPLWPTRAGFWSRMSRTLVSAPTWRRLPDQIETLPDGLHTLTTGWDGTIILTVHGSPGHLLVLLARSGESLGIIDLPDYVDNLEAVCGDGDGTIYVLFSHRTPVADTQHMHVGRIRRPHFELFLGPHAPGGGFPLDRSDSIMHVAADGTLAIGNEVDSLRVFGSDGRLRWRTPATAIADAERIAELSPASP